MDQANGSERDLDELADAALPAKDLEGPWQVATYSQAGPTCSAKQEVSLCQALKGGGFVLAIALGNGGEGLGEVLAKIAIETVRAQMLDHPPKNELEARQGLRAAFKTAHQRLKKQLQQEALRAGVSLTAAVLLKDMVVVGHFGGTAAYVLQPKKLLRVSPAHTEKLPVPDGPPAIASRLLGHDKNAIVEVTVSQLVPGEGVLLVSPSLAGLLVDQKIRRLFLSPVSAPDLCKKLVKAGLAERPHQQLSALAGYFHTDTILVAEGEKLPLWQGGILVLVLLMCVGGLWRMKHTPREGLAPRGLTGGPIAKFVDVYTTPPGAHIFFRGEYADHVTPHRLFVGRRGGELQLDKEGFQSIKVFIEPKAEGRLFFNLQPSQTVSASVATSEERGSIYGITLMTDATSLAIQRNGGAWITVEIQENGQFFWSGSKGPQRLRVKSGESEFMKDLVYPLAQPTKWFIPGPINRVTAPPPPKETAPETEESSAEEPAWDQTPMQESPPQEVTPPEQPVAPSEDDAYLPYEEGREE